MSKQNIAITVDAAVFHKADNQLKILLIQRKNDPFKEQWALPGGFLEEDESLKDGALRELEEETGLKNINLNQIEAFGEIGRDPRGRTISVAFMGLVKQEESVNGADDAQDAKWFDVKDLPKLAFDHSKIIKAGLSKL